MGLVLAVLQGHVDLGGQDTQLVYSSNKDREEDWFCSQVGVSVGHPQPKFGQDFVVPNVRWTAEHRILLSV